MFERSVKNIFPPYLARQVPADQTLSGKANPTKQVVQQKKQQVELQQQQKKPQQPAAKASGSGQQQRQEQQQKLKQVYQVTISAILGSNICEGT
jgi:hypothetical protein